MKYLHTMIRVDDLNAALAFFVDQLGPVKTRRKYSERGRYSRVSWATAPGEPELELTHGWDGEEPYSGGCNFGQVADAGNDIRKGLATGLTENERI